MALLSKVQRGQPITAELFNNMIDAIRECQINAVVGSGGTVSTFKRGPGGTTISINSRAGANAGVAQSCPFDVTATPSGSNLLISVVAGTVNNLFPVNYINCLNPQTTPISVTTSNNNYIYIQVETSGENVTSCEIKSSTTTPSIPSPTTPLPPTTINVPIAVVVTSGAVYKAIACGDISLQSVEVFRQSVTPASAGDNAYQIYYNWIMRQ